MKISEISKQIANGVGEALEELQAAQAEKRSRWFDYDPDTNVYTLTRNTVEYLGYQSDLPLLALEFPHAVKLTELEAELETDLFVEGANEDMVTGNSTEPAKLTIRVKMEHSSPSEGMMSLHKLAAREFKEFAKHFHSELFEPPENMNDKDST